MPACIVSDVRMPGQSGLDLQRMLKARGSKTPMILITGHGDISMAVTAMREGAIRFHREALRCRTAHRQHRAAVGGGAEDAITGKREAAGQPARIAELSPRQREVMDLVAAGLSSKQIALQLGISPRTVENYRAWVMERMGAGNVAELVRKVLILETDRSK